MNIFGKLLFPPFLCIIFQVLILISRGTRSKDTNNFVACFLHCRWLFLRADPRRSTTTRVCREGTVHWGWRLLFLGTGVCSQLAVWPWASQFPSLDLGFFCCKMKFGEVIWDACHTRPHAFGLVWLVDTGISDYWDLSSFPQQWGQCQDDCCLHFRWIVCGVGLVLGTGEMQCGHPRLCLPGAQLFNCTRCLHLASTVDMHDVLVIKCFIPGHIGDVWDRQNWIWIQPWHLLALRDLSRQLNTLQPQFPHL